MHERNRITEMREIIRFFHRGIAASNDKHILIFEKESIAGRAGADAIAHVEFLRGNVEQAWRGRPSQ